MDVDIRPVTVDELAAYLDAVTWSFGDRLEPDDMEVAARILEPPRTLGAFDGATLVGGTAGQSYQLTLPGPASGPVTVPAMGVTWTGVVPTHRRRGILTALMARQLDDAAREGKEAIAVLHASESGIYGRFGYGAATTLVIAELDRAHATFTRHPPIRPLPPGGGRLRTLAKDEVATVVPEVFDRYRVAQPGEVTRSRAKWAAFLRDPEKEREGASARFGVVHDQPDGTISGYVLYRFRDHWVSGVPDKRLLVEELVATTPEARTALWHYCFDVDLVGTVELRGLFVQEPLRWMLADPRRLRITRMADFLWVRLVDVAAALAARHYAAEGAVVFEVVDPFRPQSSGRYRLEAGPDGAEAASTCDDADLALDVADLGAAYLGGVSFTTLSQAGRVQELTTGALRRADALFVSHPPALCLTEF